MYIPHNRK